MANSVPKPQKTVAIVDDDPGMLVSLCDLLGARGFRTSVFASAEEWLDRGAAIYVDCMLVDVYLGGISGIELQRRLRASGSTLPVILMTARYDEATRSQALEAGCVSLLCKPFPAVELIEAIENATAA
jgi:FixJ family two-component response regulator